MQIASVCCKQRTVQCNRFNISKQDQTSVRCNGTRHCAVQPKVKLSEARNKSWVFDSNALVSELMMMMTITMMITRAGLSSLRSLSFIPFIYWNIISYYQYFHLNFIKHSHHGLNQWQISATMRQICTKMRNESCRLLDPWFLLFSTMDKVSSVYLYFCIIVIVFVCFCNCMIPGFAAVTLVW